MAYREGTDLEAREHVHNASCMAGVAFTHAQLGINHSIAHALGGHYRLPHGRANAIVLPHVIAFNAGLREAAGDNRRAAERYARLATQVGVEAFNPQQAVRGFIALIEGMLDQFSIPRTLEKAGVQEAAFRKDLPELAKIALADACTASNPRRVDQRQMEQLIGRMYNGR